MFRRHLTSLKNFKLMLTESGGTRRVRGRTLLIDLYDLDPVERVKDRERVGTSSRQKQKFTYTAGSRSFASVAEAEEVKSGQKVGRLQPFEITHRKKDGSPMTSKAGEIMKLKEKKAEYEAIASTDSSVILRTLITKLSLKFWVLKAEAAEREAEAAAREAEAAAMAAEQSKKYNDLQLQLQQMMQMFQQSQKSQF
ncbi:hypothetical protein GOBAR_AA15420 [Gossypium barbadense]|uniref:Uncharacterized protein n=1 Tax=Gossypium barbadense TaxID=3634 RepID=A0A2P5XPH5_GOSBA|nr:hypothetical protein GOBAR_AA15420 [Gossypium barbadense]